MGLCLLLLLLSVFGFISTLPLAFSGHVDFRSLYTAGYMVRTGQGQEIYNYETSERSQNELVSKAEGSLPFIHLAYETLIYVPFSFLSYRSAYFAFLAFNLLTLAFAFSILKPHLAPLQEIWPCLPLAIFACFLPVALALIQGQASIMLLALMILSMSVLEGGRDVLAGVYLGLTLFKFQYALPMAFLFLVWRRWRFLTGFAVTGLLVLGISIWITGPQAFVSYVHLLVEMSTKFSAAFGNGIHPAQMPNLRGLAYAGTGGSQMSSLVITAASSAVALLWAAMKRPSFPLALVAALLVSYHGLISDTSLMVPLIGLIMSAAAAEKSRRSLWSGIAASVVFVGPAPLLFFGPRFYLLAIPMVVLFIMLGSDSADATSSFRVGQVSRLDVSTQ
jgi:hypothetical protein